VLDAAPVLVYCWVPVGECFDEVLLEINFSARVPPAKFDISPQPRLLLPMSRFTQRDEAAGYGSTPLRGRGAIVDEDPESLLRTH